MRDRKVPRRVAEALANASQYAQHEDKEQIQSWIAFRERENNTVHKDVFYIVPIQTVHRIPGDSWSTPSGR